MRSGVVRSWAKAGYDEEGAQRVLLGIRAAKVKLSPGEGAFLNDVLNETAEATLCPGWRISYDHTEGRAVAGLEKKGLLRRLGGGEVEMLSLGVARCRAMAAA